MMTRARILASLFLLAAIANVASAKPRPIPVKVVVVAMFEQGADTGDAPGELQYWVERDHLDKIYPLPAALPRPAHERRRRDGRSHRAGNGARGIDHHGRGT